MFLFLFLTLLVLRPKTCFWLSMLPFFELLLPWLSCWVSEHWTTLVPCMASPHSLSASWIQQFGALLGPWPPQHPITARRREGQRTWEGRLDCRDGGPNCPPFSPHQQLSEGWCEPGTSQEEQSFSYLKSSDSLCSMQVFLLVFGCV